MYVADGTSPIEDGLASAFGQEDTSFTETVTGLISTVARKFSSDKIASELPEAPTPVSKSESLGSSSGSDGSLLRNPKMMGIAAALLVVVVAALYWTMGGSNELDGQPQDSLRTPSFAEADVVFDDPPVVPQTVDIEALVEEARLARDAGQLFNPVGSNAIELFAAAAAADPGNALIAAELDAAVDQTLAMAETALLESRLDDTDAALKRVTAVDPQNVRLPFLNAQLSQMQLRSRLDEARAAIRENRFEDAGTALSAARNLNLADTSEIDTVLGELRNARSAQQVDDVLAKAAARLDSGALLRPSNDNARYFYELVLSNDPGNTIARQGLNVIAAKLAFQARGDIDNGRLDAAEKVLADAQQLDSTNTEVAAAITALATARTAAAEQQRRAAAERDAVEQRRVAAEKQAAADRQADADRKAAAAVAVAAGAKTENTVSASNTIDKKTTDAGVKPATESVDRSADAELASAPNTQVGASSEPTKSKEPSTAPGIEIPTAVSSLTRTKYVAPKYPRTAQRRNLSGWVDVVFTVAIDGTVTSVEVRDSEPDQTFVNAAISAVEKWEFEPVIENGVVIEKKAGVRMMFALE
jgi:protein TonB